MTEPIWRELNSWIMEHAGPLAASLENDLCDIVGRLMAAEREACAKLAEQAERRALKAGASNTAGYCLEIASAIRARAKENQT
jgi:hypothetical protein